MSEIKTSAKGVDYADPCTLQIKKRVYSQALLMRIPHDHTDVQDISLKIGRYNIPYGLESKKPKSELTLNNEELDALIRYISESYKPLMLGQGEYINVSEESATLVENFKRLIEGQSDTARMLIENGILSDNVFLAASVIKKRDALIELREKLQEEQPERYWQEWFTRNKWVLGSDFAQIIDERVIDTENIADYIMKSYDGFVDLVEIKKPNGLPFWTSTKDHGNYVPSADLTKAITQCLNYIYAIELEANSTKFTRRIGSRVIKPRCILIFGRSYDWNDEQREAYRILNAAYNQVSILTYDHISERAQNVLGAEAIESVGDDWMQE